MSYQLPSQDPNTPPQPIRRLRRIRTTAEPYRSLQRPAVWAAGWIPAVYSRQRCRPQLDRFAAQRRCRVKLPVLVGRRTGLLLDREAEPLCTLPRLAVTYILRGHKYSERRHRVHPFYRSPFRLDMACRLCRLDCLDDPGFPGQIL